MLWSQEPEEKDPRCADAFSEQGRDWGSLHARVNSLGTHGSLCCRNSVMCVVMSANKHANTQHLCSTNVCENSYTSATLWIFRSGWTGLIPGYSLGKLANETKTQGFGREIWRQWVVKEASRRW